MLVIARCGNTAPNGNCGGYYPMRRNSIGLSNLNCLRVLEGACRIIVCCTTSTNRREINRLICNMNRVGSRWTTIIYLITRIAPINVISCLRQSHARERIAIRIGNDFPRPPAIGTIEIVGNLRANSWITIIVIRSTLQRHCAVGNGWTWDSIGNWSRICSIIFVAHMLPNNRKCHGAWQSSWSKTGWKVVIAVAATVCAGRIRPRSWNNGRGWVGRCDGIRTSIRPGIAGVGIGGIGYGLSVCGNEIYGDYYGQTADDRITSRETYRCFRTSGLRGKNNAIGRLLTWCWVCLLTLLRLAGRGRQPAGEQQAKS